MKKIKRKVTCVYGKFDNKSDFVLEPACEPDDGCPYFWIEKCKDEPEIKKPVLEQVMDSLFDVSIPYNASRFIYSWMFILVFTMGILFFQLGAFKGTFELYIVAAVIIFFVYQWDLKFSNFQGAYWIPAFFQVIWFALTITHHSDSWAWAYASWKSFIAVIAISVGYWIWKEWRKPIIK